MLPLISSEKWKMAAEIAKVDHYKGSQDGQVFIPQANASSSQRNAKTETRLHRISPLPTLPIC